MKIDKFSIFLLLFILLPNSLLLAGCDSTTTNRNDNQTLGLQKTDSIDIERVAKSITKETGVISNTHLGSSEKCFFIFEETHNSIAGQIEIAIMLNRLIRDFNINDIALEGEFASVGRVNPKWFHEMLSGSSSNWKRDFSIVALQEGEISSAEFISLVHPQADVFGVEKEEEYKLELSDEAQRAINMYLFGIVVQSITQSQYERFENLLNEKKADEAIDYLFNLNSFTKEKYTVLKSDRIMSAEESVEFYKKIQQKAENINASIDPQFKKGMNEIIAFFEMASQRSRTMVRNTLAHFSNNYSLIIGAAHTQEVEKILKEKNHSYVVITPLSLKNRIEEGEMAYSVYKRKMSGLPVDTLLLGELLSGKKKPITVINKPWFKSKAQLYLATNIIVDAFEGGAEPPFNSAYNQLSQFSFIDIDQTSIEVINGDVMFKVKIKNNNDQWEESFWIRAANVVDEDSSIDIEVQLKNALSNLKEQSNQPDDVIIIGKKKYEKRNTEKGIDHKAISPRIIMAVSKDENALRNTRVSS